MESETNNFSPVQSCPRFQPLCGIRQQQIRQESGVLAHLVGATPGHGPQDRLDTCSLWRRLEVRLSGEGARKIVRGFFLHERSEERRDIKAYENG